MGEESPARNKRLVVQIGKYEVVKHIATGGMGAVYRARDTETGRDVALKVLSPETAAKPGLLQRFEREARHAQKVRHENVVIVHDYGEYSGTHYLAMEFVEGEDLSDLLHREGTLDPETARQLVVQAAAALQAVHEQGIVHRDVKPSNLLLTTRNGKRFVKLADLGLARAADPDESRLTRDGTTVGTVDYMSPEQARDSGTADIRSDLYSLGCTWFHMLTGRPPFPDGGLSERLYRHLQETPPDVRRLNPKVSEATAAVINRLLSKKPEERYATPADLLADVALVERRQRPVSNREVLEGLAASDGKTAAPPRPGPRKLNKRGRAAAFVAPEEEAAEPEPRPSFQLNVSPLGWVIIGTTGLLLVLALILGRLIALDAAR